MNSPQPTRPKITRRKAFGGSRREQSDSNVLARARLTRMDVPKVFVEFAFNPTTISISHSAPVRDIGAAVSAKNDLDQAKEIEKAVNLTTQQVLEKVGRTIFRLGELYIDGPDILHKCGLLLGWTYSEAAKVNNQPGAMVLPTLMFSWGDFTIGHKTTPCIMTQATRTEITYQRFNRRGVPTRAKAMIELQTVTNPVAGQNPSSGGRPNRRGHELIAGESLPALSVDNYGDTESWRALAVANGIDDPLRLKPGRRLYVPEPGELSAGAITSGRVL